MWPDWIGRSKTDLDPLRGIVLWKARLGRGILIGNPLPKNSPRRPNSRNIRISSIGAFYRNPLDPTQSETARAAFLRAIEVASHLGIKNVCGFPGAVIELETNPKGNNPVYKPFEPFMPRLLDFWETDCASGRRQRCADWF